MKLSMYKKLHFLQLFAIVFTLNLNCMLRKSPEILDFRNCCLFTQEGGLTTITGPMYAGKTANLIMYVKFARDQQLKYLVFKHTFDIRTENTLKSRADIEEIPCITTPLAVYILHRVVQELPKVVFIDEAQFYSDELINVVDKMVKAGINVVVSGLDTNFRREPFGTIMQQLEQRATNKIKLQARCNVCNSLNAEYTQRLVNGRPAKKNDVDIIIDDGKNVVVTYEPRCRDCHILQ